jgi:copper(I)-binding protein
MKLPFAALLALLQGISIAQAHGYRVGNLEIVHPAIMVPSPKSDCSCVHVKITNHAKWTEYFLGAVISAAAGH